jgi:ATP-dependent Clp protease ATP-binding subunit ClpB
MNPQFTESVSTALQEAVQQAQEQRHTEVTENTLLHVFFSDPQGYFSTLATSINLNPQKLLAELKEQIKKIPIFEGKAEAPIFSVALGTRIGEAQAIAKNGKMTISPLITSSLLSGNMQESLLQAGKNNPIFLLKKSKRE